MTLTSTAVRDIPPIRHDEAMGLAAAEYQRLGALLHDLAPGGWTTATVCAPVPAGHAMFFPEN